MPQSGDWTQVKAPVLAHFAAKDDGVKPEMMNAASISFVGTRGRKHALTTITGFFSYFSKRTRLTQCASCFRTHVAMRSNLFATSTMKPAGALSTGKPCGGVAVCLEERVPSRIWR